MRLGVSLFVRDALRLDYCLEASIESVLPIADEVVVLDCESTDGTLDLLAAIARRYPKVRVVTGQPWELGTNYERLAIHANVAREQLTTPWHFMIQADEVLHEASYGVIRLAVENDGWGATTFRIRRVNLYGDIGRCVRGDSLFKPCSDIPTRLARWPYPAVGDAESIVESDGPNLSLIGHITLFHYGFVRRGEALISKTCEMQSWFHGPEGTIDERVLKMMADGGGFRYRDIIPDSELEPIPIAHPRVAEKWVRDHGG